MRPFLAALLTALSLLASPAASAQERTPLPHLGVALDAGAPGGVGLSLQWRPVDAIRLQAGPLWNYVGFGVHGGVVLVPFRWAVAPSLEAEVGHGFSADLSRFANGDAVPKEMEPLLRRVDYTYASGLLGLELGSQRRFTFFLRAGLSKFWMSAKGTGKSTDNGTTVEVTDPTIRAVIPTAKLGFQLWF